MRTVITICFASMTLILNAALASNAMAQESPSIQLFQENLEPTRQDTAEPSTETEPIEISSAQLQLIVNVEVAAKDAGVIESLQVVEGKEVLTGDVLARLDRDSAIASAEVAESELSIAKAQSKNDIDLRYAEVSKEVSGKVYQRSVNATKQFAKSVSKTETERLKLEHERASLSGEQAERTAVVNELTVGLKESQLALANVQLRNREIQSPVSGLVVQVYRQAGEWVQPGQPIARLIDLKTLRVSCRCYLKDASPDQIASEAIFVVADKQYKAKVVFVSPEIDPNVGDFIVWAEVENPTGALKPGMNGKVVLQKKKRN